MSAADVKASGWKRWWRVALGVAVAGLFVWLLLRQLDVRQLGVLMATADPRLVLVSVVTLALGYACRVLRWHAMLRLRTPALRPLQCAGPLLASFAANNVLPFRAGDIIRAFAFNERMGTTPAAVLTTVLVERMLDLLAVIAMLGLALALLPIDAGRLVGASGPLLLAAAGGILLVLLVPSVLKPLLALVDALAARVPKAARLRGGLVTAMDTLQGLSRGSTMPRLLAWSTLVWGFEGCTYFLAAAAISAIALPSAAFLALPLGTLATLIPSTPGYVGTFDYFAAQAMTLAGNDATAAAAFAFGVHMILWLLPTVAGGLYLLLRPAHVAAPAPGTESSLPR